MKSLRLPAFALALAGMAVAPAHADTPEPPAEQAAAAFCDALDVGDLGQVWDQDLGPLYQATVPRQTFVGIIGVARIQAGGPHLARTVVGEQAISQLPTGQTGDFYYVRFRTTFHNGTVFQDIYLQNLGGVWKVTASLATPAPPG
ncbi:MAG TPA: DUF4019 domain-containing protein [Caulobacteraceae bacterium]|jgi:hypothetical protein|nr:DUF4019 domain-containing protein [Caulobacteraceae bacterium]